MGECTCYYFVLSRNVYPSPRLCLLGNVNIGDQYQRKFCNLGLIAAKKMYSHQLESLIFTLNNKMEDWTTVYSYIPSDLVYHIVKQKTEIFDRIWKT